MHWHWPRHFQPRRRLLIGSIICITFLFLLLKFRFRHDNITTASNCIRDFLIKNGIHWRDDNDEADEWRDAKLAFSGNGFIGIDAANDKQLVIFPNENIKSNFFTGFYPLVEIEIPFATKESVVFTDKSGVARGISCSVVSGKCVCVSDSAYVHRIHNGLLIQEIKLVNPSSSSFSVTFKRKPSDFEQHTSFIPPVFTKFVGVGNKKEIFAVACSSIPKAAISVNPKTEENLRLICYADSTPDQSLDGKNKLLAKVSSEFSRFYTVQSEKLDLEHVNAWKTLNAINFQISRSKAPDSLNQNEIDKVRMALLSSAKAPLLERTGQAFKDISMGHDSEYCFTGISTMQIHSKLWTDSTDLRNLLRIIDIWKTTLEHRGCSNLIRKYGAHGLAQAFLLSLTAGSFSSQAKRLEFSLNPETELHRNIKLNGLHFGKGGIISVDFQLDSSLKPFVTIENVNNSLQELFACTAGCQESPHSVGKSPISLAIKMTRPITPILFISEHKSELELSRKTLHVIEVFDAPAHEQDKITLHKEGVSGGGLPTVFWLILIFLLIAFHVFLFKLIYTEWSNTSTMPYSKFNKKMLLRR